MRREENSNSTRNFPIHVRRCVHRASISRNSADEKKAGPSTRQGRERRKGVEVRKGNERRRTTSPTRTKSRQPLFCFLPSPLNLLQHNKTPRRFFFNFFVNYTRVNGSGGWRKTDLLTSKHTFLPSELLWGYYVSQRRSSI